MTECERLRDWTPRRLIEEIAVKSAAFADQAGVGGMETAGSVVSYLANHPEDIEPFLNGGVLELPVGWHERGCLTWHGQNNKVVSPEYARRARIVNHLKRGS